MKQNRGFSSKKISDIKNDELEALKDKNNKWMRELITKFPINLEEALRIASSSQINKTKSTIHNVVVCGMGGSGIGAKIVATWLEPYISVPINFCQDYNIPAYVNENTLVIASSNSGNTEETLIATESARNKGAMIIGICSGGQLQKFCDDFGFDCIIVPGTQPPRTTLAFSLVQLMNIFQSLSLVPNMLSSFNSAKKCIDDNIEEIKNTAKELANFVSGKQLIIYAASKDEGVAIRARQQFNENSKILCHHHIIPEMNHNELVGWYGGSDKYAVLFIESGSLHAQNEKRFQFAENFIKKQTPSVFHLNAINGDAIVQSLFLIHIIDWASLFLAEITDVDSIDISVIDDLKQSLAN